MVILGYKPCKPKENHIYEELPQSVCAMQNRANEPKAENEGKADEFFNINQKLRLRYHDERWSPNEVHFPVPLLSFVSPQHGRVFYAWMDKDQMVIR